MSIFSTDDLQEAFSKAKKLNEDVWDTGISYIPTDYGSPGRYVVAIGLSTDPELVEGLGANDWVLVEQ